MIGAFRRSRLATMAHIISLSTFILAPSHAAASELQVGDTPPPKLGKTASGEPVNLADYHGRVVIVSFWASWCGPCRKEMSALTALQRSVSRDQIAVFAVNWQESPQRFRLITKALKDVDLTLISDDTGHYGRLYDVTSIPHMILIGRDGRVAAIHVGYGEDRIPVLVDEINALLAKTPES